MSEKKSSTKNNKITSPNRIWSEINTSRFSWFLFPPTNSAVLQEVKEQEIDVGKEPKTTGSIRVLPNPAYPAPCQYCYDVLLAAVSIWREQECVSGKVITSLTGIAHHMGVNDSGKNLKRIHDALLSLNYTMIEFKKSWSISDNPDAPLKSQRHVDTHFSFISVAEFEYTTDYDQRFSRAVTLELPVGMIDSLTSHRSCCIDLAQRRAIHRSCSRLLYSHVDRILAITGKWTRNGDSLVEMFLPHRDSLKRSNLRLKFIENLRDDINGRATSWGTVITVLMKESNSSKLPKLIFTSDKAPKANVLSIGSNNYSANTTDQIDEIQYLLKSFLKMKDDVFAANTALNTIAKFGNIETVRIAISQVKEDQVDFSDISNLPAFFVDRFKTVSDSRGTINPFRRN